MPFLCKVLPGSSPSFCDFIGDLREPVSSIPTLDVQQHVSVPAVGRFTWIFDQLVVYGLDPPLRYLLRMYWIRNHYGGSKRGKNVVKKVTNGLLLQNWKAGLQPLIKQRKLSLGKKTYVASESNAGLLSPSTSFIVPEA